MKKSLLLIALAHFYFLLPAQAKGVQEAVGELTSVNDSQPQAFTLMIICIGLIVTLACTLMIVTVTYAFKRKPDTASK